ncbi:MAG: type II secretion system GspH family protein [Firmicutes bacterium]|nr:type II secretion system GspH family protein [[Eubacterium] siraeum]MCM1488439.1 type II secretion system GspH family protein [Bacillota bacterium]
MLGMIQRLKRKKGFTLVELIVVIAIVAVLTAVIVPLIGQYSTQAAYTTLQDGAKTISNDLNTCMSTYSSKGSPCACTKIRGVKNGGDLQIGFEGAPAAEVTGLGAIIKESLNATLPKHCAFTAEVSGGAVEGVVYSIDFEVSSGTVASVDGFQDAYTVDGEAVGVAGKYQSQSATVPAFSGTLS